MGKYKIGDKLICMQNIKNIFGYNLFLKNEEYEILNVFYNINVDNINVTFIVLDHILIGNEYNEYTEDFVIKNFKTKKEIRKMKLDKIKKY